MKPTVKTLADTLGFTGASLPGTPGGHDFLSLSNTPTIKDFCRAILESEEYRKSILDRVILCELPPAVECKMYDYAYGKPPDKVEHTGKDGTPIEMITEVRRVIVRSSDLTEDEPVTNKEVTH